MVKFKEVIQNILFFLGKTKATINAPQKTYLNWKLVKSSFINDETFNGILNWTIEGPKEEEYEFYRKTPLLLETCKFILIQSKSLMKKRFGVTTLDWLPFFLILKRH